MAAWSDTPKRAEQEKNEKREVTFREIACQIGQELRRLVLDLCYLPSKFWQEFWNK